MGSQSHCPFQPGNTAAPQNFAILCHYASPSTIWTSRSISGEFSQKAQWLPTRACTRSNSRDYFNGFTEYIEMGNYRFYGLPRRFRGHSASEYLRIFHVNSVSAWEARGADLPHITITLLETLDEWNLCSCAWMRKWLLYIKKRKKMPDKDWKTDFGWGYKFQRFKSWIWLWRFAVWHLML